MQADEAEVGIEKIFAELQVPKIGFCHKFARDISVDRGTQGK